MDVLKLAVLAIGGIMLALMFRKQKPEYSLLVSMAICLVIFLCLMSKLRILLFYIRQLEAMTGLDTVYVKTIFQMLGITYITKLAADLCRDAGYQGVSGQMELFAKVSLVFMSFPVLFTLIQTIEEVLG